MSAIAIKTANLMEDLAEHEQNIIFEFAKSIHDKLKNVPKNEIDEDDKITIDATTGQMYLMGTPLLLAPDTGKVPKPNGLQGLMTIPEDFDEPLEEMMEYMY